MAKISSARLQFLKGTSKPDGMTAFENYAPAKWALAEGLVETRGEAHWGHSRYYLTEKGKALLAQQKG